MGVYNKLSEYRKEQFKQQKLKHVHNFRGELGTRNTALELYLEGRDGDQDAEADGIFIPENSFIQFHLSYQMIRSGGAPVDAESSVHIVERSGPSGLAINNDVNYPAILVEHSAGTATERVDLKAKSSNNDSNNDKIVLEANQDATSNTVFVHAQLEVLSLVATDLDYLYFQSN